MTDIDERETKAKPSGEGRPPKLELKKTVETGQVRQSFAHGRSKMVTVEVRKKRTFSAEPQRGRDGKGERDGGRSSGRGRGDAGRDAGAVSLTTQEKAARARALQDAMRADEDRSRTDAAAPMMFEPVVAPEPEPAVPPPAEAVPADVAAAPETEAAPAAVGGGVEPAVAAPPAEGAGTPAAREEAVPVPAKGAAPGRVPARDDARPDARPDARGERSRPVAPRAGAAADGRPVRGREASETARPKEEPAATTADAAAAKLRARDADEGDDAGRGRPRRGGGGAVRSEVRRPPTSPVRRADDASWRGKLTVSDALDDGGERVRSLASVRRARQKERLKNLQAMRQEAPKVVRDVIVPETITVQELANRMAERAADVMKTLMKMGVMATITQTIDGDTAELVVAEFGHNVRRVSEADVELGLHGEADSEEHQVPRPPVVTVMGHVDHGKTSLLDALRRTDVAAHEAGGITQHIGAYQVRVASGEKITFIDTPGHAAFTAMRARGAKVTDIVILVVAADDGVMPQTVEAIAHARAAKVPMIVAINKTDKPDANPRRVLNELLQHEVVPEEMGGETQCVEVSAKQGTNLDKLVESILLQAEVLDLKANPNRPAEGVIVETKIERGRGSVATVLVQRGTLRLGDNFVAGSEWGRIRGLTDASGAAVEAAEPGMPVEVLGLNGPPRAGDDLIVVDSESRARDVAEFRQRRLRDARVTPAQRGTLEQMMTKIREGEGKELPLVIKADVHGSAEAIVGALEKLGQDEVKVNVLHSGVGGINESDVGLARASGALVIGFNVRANPQAREMARRDGVEIRYYSIIYDLTDDIKKVLSGMLAPQMREHTLGYAQIREVFNISKVGKVAGCMVTEGLIRRGTRVRLLRDNVVIHEGELGQLKRFKDDAREVKEGYDCGISLASYQDIQVGDVIECFEVEEVAQQL